MLKRFLLLNLLLAIIISYCYLTNSHSPHEVLNESRWVKLDNAGLPLKPWAGPWNCVKDTETGLIWEVKNDSENIHDGYWTYSWFNGRFGQQNMGDCYFESERCDTQDLVVRMNQESYCGYSSWRLPTEQELMTLVTEPTKVGAPSIRNDYFPKTKSGDYWTSEGQKELTQSFKHLGFGATAINFKSGESVTLPYRNAAFLRLVTKESY